MLNRQYVGPGALLLDGRGKKLKSFAVSTAYTPKRSLTAGSLQRSVEAGDYTDRARVKQTQSAAYDISEQISPA